MNWKRLEWIPEALELIWLIHTVYLVTLTTTGVSLLLILTQNTGYQNPRLTIAGIKIMGHAGIYALLSLHKVMQTIMRKTR